MNGPEANVRGVELALQHVFGNSGFGVQANATLVDTNRKFPTADTSGTAFAITGLANSANFVAFCSRGVAEFVCPGAGLTLSLLQILETLCRDISSGQLLGSRKSHRDGYADVLPQSEQPRPAFQPQRIVMFVRTVIQAIMMLSPTISISSVIQSMSPPAPYLVTEIYDIVNFS